MLVMFHSGAYQNQVGEGCKDGNVPRNGHLVMQRSEEEEEVRMIPKMQEVIYFAIECKQLHE